MDRKFRVLKGGLDSTTNGTKTFVEAYVTDTRLMGVVGLYICWENESEDEDLVTNFHQFFYFDAEEYGFETYKSSVGGDLDEIRAIEIALLGGLGGKKVSVTEKEACFLVQDYVRMNRRLGIPLPGEQKEYQFILNKDIALSPLERRKIFNKMSDSIVSDFQAVNYFLMRCFGHDFFAAKYLTNGRVAVELYPEYPMATFCKNNIEVCEDKEGTYICKSLIEFNGTYHLVVSEVDVENLTVIGYKKHSSMKISSAEAAMMLARAEFITLYNLLIDDTEFIDESIVEFTPNNMLTMHENGKMYLIFNEDNSHVNRQEYRLNADVYGMVYVSESGQMILASYDLENIMQMEKDLTQNPLAGYLVLESKYEFKEPILYEFVHSGFEDFEEFIDLIRE